MLYQLQDGVSKQQLSQEREREGKKKKEKKRDKCERREYREEN